MPLVLKRIPILPTLIVLIAVGIMVRLGVWQLDRMYQKEALLVRYAAAAQNSTLLKGLPLNSDPVDFLYRRIAVNCSKVTGWLSIAGHNQAEQPGFAHIALCKLDGRFTFDGPGYDTAISIGWSTNPGDPDWRGGQVTGMLGPFKKGQAKIVANPPLAGLTASAEPDPNNTPNNHWSYAIQWFLFAATALVIYGLALRKRLAGQ